MSNQVNPLGSLVAGVLQTASVAPKTPSATSEKSTTSAAAQSQVKAPGQRSEAVSKESLDSAAKEVKDYLKSSQSDLEFSVDKDTGTIVFKIVKASTHEVIRQVPAEEVLAMARKLRAISNASDAPGVLVDEKG